jgi:hypothetical protein
MQIQQCSIGPDGKLHRVQLDGSAPEDHPFFEAFAMRLNRYDCGKPEVRRVAASC